MRASKHRLTVAQAVIVDDISNSPFVNITFRDRNGNKMLLRFENGLLSRDLSLVVKHLFIRTNVEDNIL